MVIMSLVGMCLCLNVYLLIFSVYLKGFHSIDCNLLSLEMLFFTLCDFVFVRVCLSVCKQLWTDMHEDFHQDLNPAIFKGVFNIRRKGTFGHFGL